MTALSSLVWLVPLLPLMAAAATGLHILFYEKQGDDAEKIIGTIVSAASAAAFLLLAGLGLLSLVQGAPGEVVAGRWLQAGDYRIGITFLLDGYSLGLAVLVAFIAFLSIRFSINYLHRESGFRRFFMLLSLFNCAMLLIVLAGNAPLMFIGWELAGLSSYLLIAYAQTRRTATENANRAFVTNRIGDAAFLLGIYFSFSWLGGADWQHMAQATVTDVHDDLIAGSFLIAALAKSAQIPFAGWIALALEGPTPSSAVFYGSLMVHAGVFLLIRLENMILHAPLLMMFLTAIGLTTAVYGWLSALVQTDVKSSFMFSTTAQTGLMFMACGLGWFEAVKWYLPLHMAWRAGQFLHAPSLMHQIQGRQRLAPQWLRNNAWLYNAALRRFWLDPLADASLLRPTQALARDLCNFDDKVVNRLVGLPHERPLPGSATPGSSVGHGQGVAGRFMEVLARGLQWFEEHLILRGGGESLIAGIQRLGKYMQQVEILLGQPRYLILLIAATFVVIL